jgi:hypothetical protein
MNENIVIVALVSAIICFIMAYAITLKKLITSQKLAGKLYVDNFTLEEYIKTIKNLKEDKTDQQIHQENFLKFLSDSRDWAFNYIEEVQSGLKKFVSDIEPEINYFREYGDLMAMQPNYYSLKKITEAYEELKNLLPKEEEEVK